MENDILCEKLRALEPYRTEAGEPVPIHLDANESFIPLSDAMRRELGEKLAAAAFNRYPDPLARDTCAAFGRRYGIDPRFITAGNGSDELLSVLFNTFVQRGETAVLTAPDFSMYRIYAGMAETRPVVVAKNGDLTFDPEELIAVANREHARMVLFSNPCNPTGQGFTAAQVLDMVRRIHSLVVVDEAYMDFWDESIMPHVAEYENLMVLRTCSKVGLAAARLGFAVAGDRLTERLRAAKSPYNVNALTQTTGTVFLNDRKWLDGAVASILRSRDELFAGLSRLSGSHAGRMRVFPSHTNFVTVCMPDAAECRQSLQGHGISVRLLGGELLRITTGAPEENRALLDALEKHLSAPAKKEDSR